MATIADNIRSMAALVQETKTRYRLTENTVLRIVDMNFALAQSAGNQSFSGDEDLPFDTDENGIDPMALFPGTDSDIEAVEEVVEEEDDTLATTQQQENLN